MYISAAELTFVLCQHLSVWSYTHILRSLYLNIIRMCVLNSLSYSEKHEDDKNKHFHLSYN